MFNEQIDSANLHAFEVLSFTWAKRLSTKCEMGSRLKLSGMQKQVLGLYRGFLRAARLKAAEERRAIESVVSTEFRHNAKNVDRKNFIYIEYLLRRGKKQLEQLKNPDTTGLLTLKVSAKEN